MKAAAPAPLNMSSSGSTHISEQNFRQLPNQPETPHRRPMQRPQPNVNRAQERKKRDLREQRNQNMKQLPNQPETPHFQSQTFRHVQEKDKPHAPSQPIVRKEETSENDPINQFECWPPKEFLEDEEISDENVIEPTTEHSAERSATMIRIDQNIVMTEEDEETLQMMEKISMMNSSDFIRNDTVMDPDVAKFFLMGEIRRNRMKKKAEEKRSANIYSIKGKAKMMEEENNKMHDLYGEHKMLLQSRKLANDSAFKKLQEQNKLQVWPSVPLQI